MVSSYKMDPSYYILDSKVLFFSLMQRSWKSRKEVFKTNLSWDSNWCCEESNREFPILVVYNFTNHPTPIPLTSPDKCINGALLNITCSHNTDSSNSLTNLAWFLKINKSIFFSGQNSVRSTSGSPESRSMFGYNRRRIVKIYLPRKHQHDHSQQKTQVSMKFLN
jgi:hypothetical protein